MKRRKAFGPPREPHACDCRRCGGRIVWLPFSACCGRAAECYGEAGRGRPRPATCQPGQDSGYCGKRDGPVAAVRIRVALWAAGPGAGSGETITGWTVKGDRVTGRRLTDLEPEIRAEAVILVRHQCDEAEVLRRKLANVPGYAQDDLAAARAYAEMGGQDRAAGEV